MDGRLNKWMDDPFVYSFVLPDRWMDGRSEERAMVASVVSNEKEDILHLVCH